MNALKDLVVLVAGKNELYAFKGALKRPEALGIRSISVEFLVHPNRDGGVRKTGVAMLALKRRQFSHALLVLDYEGCGSELTPKVLESDLDEQLKPRWNDRAKAIVIEPEVDVWMWGSDNAVQQVIGWASPPAVREWLKQRGFELNRDGKPLRPKEAMDAVTKESDQPRSSALYEEIAGKISLQRCTDAAFQRLRHQLILWFPT
jgi:hypothetical protein